MVALSTSTLPKRLTVIAGTYDGVIAGWSNETDADGLEMAFAMPAHEGSVRSLSVLPDTGMLVSGGFDETLKVYDLKKSRETGETKTPQDLGTSTCSEFAPPEANGTHMLVGLTSGRIAFYKRKDWNIVHVLGGHEGGVSCMACHPSGKLALSGGLRDGSMRLWDLTKGRLAFVHKLTAVRDTKKALNPAVSCIRWSSDGSRYVFCFGKRITARDAASGKDLIDIELPSRPNQVCFLGKNDECIACACDDGSLPLLGVGVREDDEDEGAIRAVMAIEGVDRVAVGDDRFKCIQRVRGGKSAFLVATANSGGVVSIINLEGASRALADGFEEGGGNSEDDSDADSDDEEDEEEDLAVFLASVRVGSGARITNLAVWSDTADREEKLATTSNKQKKSTEETSNDKKRKRANDAEKANTVKLLDSDAVSRARALIDQAKRKQKKKNKKQKKKRQE